MYKRHSHCSFQSVRSKYNTVQTPWALQKTKYQNLKSVAVVFPLAKYILTDKCSDNILVIY